MAAHVVGEGLQPGGGARDEGEATHLATAGEQARDGGADAARGADDGDVPLRQGRKGVEHPPGLGLDGCRGERVSVGHADVGAAAQRDAPTRDGGGQGAEPDGSRAQAHGAVDRPGHPGAPLLGSLQEVAGTERHEDDVPHALATDLDGGHREGGKGKAAQGGVVDAVGHAAERAPEASQVLGEVGAGMNEEGEGVWCAHDNSWRRALGKGRSVPLRCGVSPSRRWERAR